MMPWHDDPFLLLPGDGLLLLDDAGLVLHADRFVCELVPDAPTVGAPLATAWPELWRSVCAQADAVSASGPAEEVVDRVGVPVSCRIFRPDSGHGVVVMAPEPQRSMVGPSAVMYDRVLRSVNESIIVTTAEPFDAPGPVIVYVNDAFLRESGFTWHEVIGRSPRIVQPADAPAETRQAFRDAMQAWRSATVEIENVRKDGSHFWVEIDIAAVPDDTGWFTHWVSVQQDITRRKADELEREGRRAMIRAILDSLPSQSVLLDGEGRIVATNEQWQLTWREFGQGAEPDWTGVDYLAACLKAANTTLGGADDALAVHDGIRSVLGGAATSFGHDYEMVVEGTSLWFHMEVLPLRGAEGVVVTHADITRRRTVEDALGYQSRHDLLTGLSNRDAIRAALEECVASARPCALVLIDLDDFRTVNDAFGHHYGDRLLEVAAERLEAVVGLDDVVGRMGGDEFAVVVRDCAPGWDPSMLCDAIRVALAEPVDLDIVSARLSASIGVVAAPPHPGDADAIIRDADTAMYVSKSAGRDRWTLFADDQRLSARARAISRDRVSAALAAGEFELHFQPFIDLDTGRTVGSEALLRWRDPVEGLLLPGRFLSAIESGPLIEEVGAWVLDRALAVQAAWQAQRGHEQHVMSVNVSPFQLGRGRLPGVVADALAHHAVAEGTLGLEILESAVVTSGAGAEAELRELHASGIRIAIDDFGTGYSALAYLQSLPVDGVKIDRGFIQRSASPRGARLLRAAGELARAVGATSIAEGIETPQQLAAAQAAGIMWGQGFLLGRPEPAEDTPAACRVKV